MKENFLITVVAVIALLAGYAVYKSQQLEPALASQEVVSLLEKTQLPDADNKQHRLNEWQGKILILNFWATWCPPCLEEIPDFIELQQQYQHQNLQFVGIAIEEKQSLVEHPLYSKINYPTLIAGNNGIAISKSFGNLASVVPFTVVINQNNEIVHRQLGEFSRQEVLKVITPLLKL